MNFVKIETCLQTHSYCVSVWCFLPLMIVLLKERERKKNSLRRVWLIYKIILDKSLKTCMFLGSKSFPFCFICELFMECFSSLSASSEFWKTVFILASLLTSGVVPCLHYWADDCINQHSNERQCLRNARFSLPSPFRVGEGRMHRLKPQCHCLQGIRHVQK